MTNEVENPKNAVERSVTGGFTAVWHGRTVYENGRVKKFETEDTPASICFNVMRRARSFAKARD